MAPGGVQGGEPATGTTQTGQQAFQKSIPPPSAATSHAVSEAVEVPAPLGTVPEASSGSPYVGRPLSDTPLMSYQGSMHSASAGSTAASSGTHSPKDRTAQSGIPPLTLPQRRATTLDVPGLTSSKVSPDGKIAARDIESKLVIVMVGLPARGKSYVTKKLARFLNWQQHSCRIFNVGNTRRQANQNVGPSPVPLPDRPDRAGAAAEAAAAAAAEQAEVEAKAAADEEAGAPIPTQDAEFFSPDNKATFQLREQWAMDTLDQLLDFIMVDNGSVGILDATNTTRARRRRVFDRIRERSGGRLKVLFLECICTKSDVIDANIRLKLSGPDYKDMDKEKALADFVGRLRNYEKAYETIGPEEEAEPGFQYIKMINVGQKVECANIQGFLAGQTVFFLLNFNLAERQIWITRHGESTDNAAGRIGGDAPLTSRGHKFSAALHRFMDFQKTEFRRRQLEKFQEHTRLLRSNGSEPTTPASEPEEPHFCVWTSMLQRSIQTAEPFDDEKFDIKQIRMLNELGAGQMDGMTYREIEEKYPREYAARIQDKIRYRYPGIGGESYLDVINRLRPLIVEMERMEDNALIICHRVVARVLLAYFMNLGRESIGDLDVPLHTLYVLEPKPYGVDWALYQYNEETDWFYRIPKETLQEQQQSARRANRRDSVAQGDQAAKAAVGAAASKLKSESNADASQTKLQLETSTESRPSRRKDEIVSITSPTDIPEIMAVKNRQFSVMPTAEDADLAALRERVRRVEFEERQQRHDARRNAPPGAPPGYSRRRRPSGLDEPISMEIPIPADEVVIGSKDQRLSPSDRVTMT